MAAAKAVGETHLPTTSSMYAMSASTPASLHAATGAG